MITYNHTFIENFYSEIQNNSQNLDSFGLWYLDDDEVEHGYGNMYEYSSVLLELDDLSNTYKNDKYLWYNKKYKFFETTGELIYKELSAIMCERGVLIIVFDDTAHGSYLNTIGLTKNNIVKYCKFINKIITKINPTIEYIYWIRDFIIDLN